MKNWSVLSLLALGLFLAAGLVACTAETSEVPEKTKDSAEVSPVNDETSAVGDAVMDAAKEAAGCPGCTALKAGATGWCADCGTGFHEGKEVTCKKECGMNPGGPPCKDCVK
jgi:hypothetical protein